MSSVFFDKWQLLLQIAKHLESVAKGHRSKSCHCPVERWTLLISRLGILIKQGSRGDWKSPVIQKWKPPVGNKLKLNVDAAVKGWGRGFYGWSDLLEREGENSATRSMNGLQFELNPSRVIDEVESDCIIAVTAIDQLNIHAQDDKIQNQSNTTINEKPKPY
ncbi:hypothetical protein Adt_48553 [Abeliophyllum distichum]|uniref:Uncharacterized protein n=1 Tax=Abeliophyllum distichum TaxID=126358 RepID=A0ABD1NQQ9_9LAMI